MEGKKRANIIAARNSRIELGTDKLCVQFEIYDDLMGIIVH